MLTNFATKTRASLRNFRKNNKGVTAIEYGLIAVVMAAFIVFAFSGNDSFVSKLKSKFSDVAGNVDKAKFDSKSTSSSTDSGNTQTPQG